MGDHADAGEMGYVFEDLGGGFLGFFVGGRVVVGEGYVDWDVEMVVFLAEGDLGEWVVEGVEEFVPPDEDADAVDGGVLGAEDEFGGLGEVVEFGLVDGGAVALEVVCVGEVGGDDEGGVEPFLEGGWGGGFVDFGLSVEDGGG